MRVLLVIILYVIFFSYRISFWDFSLRELINMSTNALFDTICCYGAGYAMFLLSRYKKEAVSVLLKALGVIGIFFISSVVLWSLHLLVYTLTGSMEPPFSDYFYHVDFQMFDLICVVGVGSAVTYSTFNSKALKEQEKTLSELSDERRIAELKFLRSQMDPHFIFNTLNTIKYSINSEDKVARKLVSDFSDLFRFHLYEFNELLVPLEKEIAFIKNYLEILKVRKIDTQEIFLDISGDTENKLIPPLVIIPIVENCVKHSSNFSLGKKSLISIQIEINEKDLVVRSRNTKGNNEQLIKERAGIGLENIKKRLSLQYPNEHNLLINEDIDSFEVILTIPVVNEVLHNR